MIVPSGPLVIAGMPLQRTPNGFLAKRMRRVDGKDASACEGGVATPPFDRCPLIKGDVETSPSRIGAAS